MLTWTIQSYIHLLHSAESSGEAAQRIGGYLDALATGSALSGGAGISSHVNSLGSSTSLSGSASAVKSYLDSMSSGSVVAPSAPVVQNYLEDVSSGAASTPTSGAGISSYIGALASTNVLSGGAGISSHVNNLGSATQVSGAGIPSYLDNVNQEDKEILEGEIFNQVFSNKANGSTAPNETTTVDTQVSHNGDQTTITTTTVTTVIVNEPVYA